MEYLFRLTLFAFLNAALGFVAHMTISFKKKDRIVALLIILGIMVFTIIVFKNPKLLQSDYY